MQSYAELLTSCGTVTSSIWVWSERFAFGQQLNMSKKKWNYLILNENFMEKSAFSLKPPHKILIRHCIVLVSWVAVLNQLKIWKIFVQRPCDNLCTLDHSHYKIGKGSPPLNGKFLQFIAMNPTHLHVSLRIVSY